VTGVQTCALPICGCIAFSADAMTFGCFGDGDQSGAAFAEYLFEPVFIHG
jgi:hypothetical protein